MTKEDIKNMDIIKFPAALQYSWITYINRDVRYNMSMDEKKSGGGSNGSTLDMNWSAVNPIVQASKGRKIPQKFLDSMEKDDE